MCNFFAFTTHEGKYYYHDWADRQAALAGTFVDDYGQPLIIDSHASIAVKAGVTEDVTNKFEYNPLTRGFRVDQLNTIDNSHAAERWVRRLDFKKVCPLLVIKPIVHPFRDRRPRTVTNRDLERLAEWASVGASVGASVLDSVGASVGASVWASVWDSVWASVGASVGAYAASFLSLAGGDKYKSLRQLWNRGLVPSFDGKFWRLHGGKDGAVMWTGTVKGGMAVTKEDANG